MSSSRVVVASFRLIRSVALSLLRLLSCDISFCRVVAILVRVRICIERLSSDWGSLTMAVEPFVMFARGVSGSFGVEVVLIVFWVLMVCSAIIVADCGGVFSPRML
jgi:hypothetical protein